MRRGIRTIALVLLALALLTLTGCGSAKKQAVEEFEQEREKIEFQAGKLQNAIENGEGWLDSGKEPADPRVRAALEKKIGEAKQALDGVEIPEMPEKTDEIVAATEKLREQEMARLCSELEVTIKAFHTSVREKADADIAAAKAQG